MKMTLRWRRYDKGVEMAIVVGYLWVHPAVAVRTIPKRDIVLDNVGESYSLFLCKPYVEPLLLQNPHVNTEET